MTQLPCIAGCGGLVAATATLCSQCGSSQLDPGAVALPPLPEGGSEPGTQINPGQSSDAAWFCGRGHLNEGTPFCATPDCDDPEPRTERAGAPATGLVADLSTAGVQLVLPDRTSLAVLDSRPLLLGRGTNNSQVDAAFSAYPNVSRRHLTVTVQGTSVTVMVHRPSNETFVNGALVPHLQHVTMPLRELRTIELGSTMLMVRHPH